MRIYGATLAALTLVAGCKAYDRSTYRLLLDGRASALEAAAPDDEAPPDHADASEAALDVFDAAMDDMSARPDVPTPPADVIEPTHDASADAAPDAAPDAATTNQVINGSFEATGSTWLSPWSFYVFTAGLATVSQDATTATDGTHSARIDVSTASTINWHVQLQLHHLNTIAGHDTVVSFAAKASAPGTYSVGLQLGMAPGTTYTSANFAATTSWQTFTLHYLPTVSDPDTELVIDFALHVGTVWIDDVTMTP